MTDYSTLDNRELDKLVAERLGYKAFSYFDKNYQEVRWNFHINGEKYNFAGYDEDTLWRNFIPHYSTDANAALALIKSTFRLETGRAASDRVMWRANVMLDEAFWVTADTPARAIVLAWLAWQEAAAKQG